MPKCQLAVANKVRKTPIFKLEENSECTNKRLHTEAKIKLRNWRFILKNIHQGSKLLYEHEGMVRLFNLNLLSLLSEMTTVLCHEDCNSH